VQPAFCHSRQISSFDKILDFASQNLFFTVDLGMFVNSHNV
jgi:hypothetical protein